MKRILSLLLCLLMVGMVLIACAEPNTPPEVVPPDDGTTDDTTPPDTDPDKNDPDKNDPGKGDSNDKEPEIDMTYAFDGSVSHEVLCNYLSHAVTISLENNYTMSQKSPHVKSFILNTGAKYICRAATSWSPSGKDLTREEPQREFIASVHAEDPTVVFEACIFECVSVEVNQIPIPAYVFEAFDLPVEKRNFDFSKMRFPDGRYYEQWGKNSTVPDITQLETQMFFYYRGCNYIDLGFEGLHMGQVHLIGATDTNYTCFFKIMKMIREYASEHARRHFVFINAHTHGIKDADDNLMFDFHMYPSRPMAIGTETHAPTEDEPLEAIFEENHSDSIYGKSMGGITPSGWECTSLPYLVELDNYGDDVASLFVPKPNDWRVYGYDEISWYANQPAWYRQEFLEYAYIWVMDDAPGDGFFAMPGQRTARYYDENKNILSWQYYAYDPKNFAQGNGDEAFIKEIWEVYGP